MAMQVEDPAKTAFFAQFSWENNSPEGAFETLLERCTAYMGHCERFLLQEQDVRFAAESCGFSAVPSPLRHNPRNSANIVDLTQSFMYSRHFYVTVTKDAVKVLSFLHDVLSVDPTTRFSIETDDNGPTSVIKLDSPRGIHAHFAVHDWNVDDENDDEEDGDYYENDDEEDGDY